MASRRSSRQDLKSQLENLEKKIDSNMIKRSTSLYGFKNKEDQILGDSNSPNDLSKRDRLRPIRNSIHHVNDREGENFNFVKDLSDNLLLQCRKLQRELETSKQNITHLELQKQQLDLTKSELDSKNLSLNNELEALKDEISELKNSSNVHVNDQNNVILSQHNYKNLLNNTVDRIAKDDLVKYVFSRYHLVSIPNQEYQFLNKPVDEMSLQKEAEKLGYVAMPRQNLDHLKAKAESPDENTVKLAAKSMGLQLVNSKELENLKNPTKSELEKKIQKLGYVMVQEGINQSTTVAGTNKSNSPSPSPLKSKTTPSSRVMANREFFEQVIREENNKKDVILESGRSLGFVRLSTEQYKKLLEGQKEHVITKTDVYSAAKDFQLTVLPNEEYKSLLKKKNYTDSLSFDDLNEFANKLQLKLMPLASKKDSSRRNSSQFHPPSNTSSLQGYHKGNRSRGYSTDSLASHNELSERNTSNDASLGVYENNSSSQLDLSKNHDGSVEILQAKENNGSTQGISLESLKENCLSMGYVMVAKQEYESLIKPPTIQTLKNQVSKNNLKLLTITEYTNLNSKEHLMKLLGNDYKVLNNEEFLELNKPKPVSLEAVKDYVAANNFKLLPLTSYEDLKQKSEREELPEKQLTDFPVSSIKEFLESHENVVTVQQDQYDDLLKPKNHTLDELVNEIHTRYPEKIILDKATYEEDIIKSFTLDDIKEEAEKKNHILIAKEDYSEIQEELSKFPTDLPIEALKNIAETKGFTVISEDELSSFKKPQKHTIENLKDEATNFNMILIPEQEYSSLHQTLKEQATGEHLSIESLQRAASLKEHAIISSQELSQLNEKVAAKNITIPDHDLTRTELLTQASKNGFSMIPQNELHALENKLKSSKLTEENIESRCITMGYVAVPTEEYEEIMDQLDTAKEFQEQEFNLYDEAKKQDLMVISNSDFDELKKRLEQASVVENSNKQDKKTAKKNKKAGHQASSNGLENTELSDLSDADEDMFTATSSNGRTITLDRSESSLREEALKLGLVVISKDELSSFTNNGNVENITKHYNVHEEADKLGLVLLSKEKYRSLIQLELETKPSSISDDNGSNDATVSANETLLSNKANSNSLSKNAVFDIKQEAKKLGLIVMGEDEVTAFKQAMDEAHRVVEAQSQFNVEVEAKKAGCVVITQEHFDSLNLAIEEAQKAVDNNVERTLDPHELRQQAMKQGLMVLTREEFNSLKEAVEEAQLGIFNRKYNDRESESLVEKSINGPAEKQMRVSGDREHDSGLQNSSSKDVLLDSTNGNSLSNKNLTPITETLSTVQNNGAGVQTIFTPLIIEEEALKLGLVVVPKEEYALNDSNDKKFVENKDTLTYIESQAEKLGMVVISKNELNYWKAKLEKLDKRQSKDHSFEDMNNFSFEENHTFEADNNNEKNKLFVSENHSSMNAGETPDLLDEKEISPMISTLPLDYHKDFDINEEAFRLGLVLLNREEYEHLKNSTKQPHNSHTETQKFDETNEESYIEHHDDKEEPYFNTSKFEDVGKKHNLVVLSKVTYNKLATSLGQDPYDFTFETESEVEEDNLLQAKNIAHSSSQPLNVEDVSWTLDAVSDNLNQNSEENANTYQENNVSEKISEGSQSDGVLEHNDPVLFNKDIITEKAKEFGLIAIEEEQFREITNQLASQELTPEEVIMKAREYGMVSIGKEQFEEIKNELENPVLNKEQLARIALEQHNLILVDKNEYRELKRIEPLEQSQNKNTQEIFPDSPSLAYNAASRTNSLIKVRKPIRQVSLTSNSGHQRKTSMSSLNFQHHDNSFNEHNSPDAVFVPTLQAPSVSRVRPHKTSPLINFKDEAKKNGYLCLPESCYIAPSSSTTTNILPVDGPVSNTNTEEPGIDSNQVVILPKEHYKTLLEYYTTNESNLANDNPPHHESGSQNLRDDVSLNTNASLTDYNVIAALTQTVIGEYLYKYYPKFGIFTKVRHERYFWIHPYTMTLYWSQTNPALTNSSSSNSFDDKTKGCAIIDVYSVEDANPYPPGLYHKSIIIKTDSHKNKEIKITCSTRSRHNIWFNSLKYLVENNNVASGQHTENFNGVSTQVVKHTSGNHYNASNTNAPEFSNQNKAFNNQGLNDYQYNTHNYDKNSYFFVKSLANDNLQNSPGRSNNNNNNNNKNNSGNFLSKTFARRG